MFVCTQSLIHTQSFLRGFSMPSSQECGPFIGFNTSYSVISDAVDDWKESNNSGFIKGLVEVLTSAAFYITIFIIVWYVVKLCREINHLTVFMLFHILLTDVFDSKFKGKRSWPSG